MEKVFSRAFLLFELLCPTRTTDLHRVLTPGDCLPDGIAGDNVNGKAYHIGGSFVSPSGIATPGWLVLVPTLLLLVGHNPRVRPYRAVPRVPSPLLPTPPHYR